MKISSQVTSTDDSHPSIFVGNLGPSANKRAGRGTDSPRGWRVLGQASKPLTSAVPSLIWDREAWIFGALDTQFVKPKRASSTACLTIEESTAYARIDWKLHVQRATSHREITDLLRVFGRISIANRLDYLHEQCEEDSEDQPLNLESTRTLAKFTLTEGWMPRPQLGVTPNGFLTSQWRLQPDGIVAMEFHEGDWLRFVGIEGKLQPSDRRIRISIDGTLHDVVDHLGRFFAEP